MEFQVNMAQTGSGSTTPASRSYNLMYDLLTLSSYVTSYNLMYDLLTLNSYLTFFIVASVRRQRIGMQVYKDFLDWMRFDREAKRHFLTAFRISLAFLWSLVFATVVREPRISRIFISRQIDVNWNRG